MATKEWFENNQDKLRAYRREWYKRNKEHAKEKVANRRRELAAWMVEYKRDLKCSRCDEDHVGTLDFHHIDPEQKDMEVSGAIHNGWSVKRILEEISKCIVLCSNCHRKLHFNETQVMR